LFYFNGRWYTSTHRTLNAFHSKWASKESFGTAFKKALESEVENNAALRNALPAGTDGLFERFLSMLDSSKQYMFLVLHNEENRIVCAAPKRPTLFHVGTFVDNELVMTENIHIPYPRKHVFRNMNELLSYVDKVDIRDLQGVIVFAPDGRKYKILQSEYVEFFRARGNQPSIKFRYLEVRMTPEMVNRLYYLYPECKDVFDRYENSLYAIAKIIYNSYVQRHIKGKWSTLPPEEYRVDCACHAWHESDRKNNRVTLERVITVMNEQSPSALNQMIRRFSMGETQPQENAPTAQAPQGSTHTRVLPKRNTPKVPPTA
jgi:hypothetical protein